MPTPTPQTAVLFDLDGTLLDTAPDLAGALNRVRALRNEPLLPLSTIQPTVSAGTPAMIRCAFEMTSTHPEYPMILQQFLHFYRTGIAEETRPFPGITAVLERLEARRILWGVVTNKPAYLTEPLMRALGLWDRAAVVISGDTLSSKKPEPTPLLHACAQIGAYPNHSYYIGDAERDIAAGRRAGMTTLVASFGYVNAEDQPETWGADGFLDTPEDVWKWVA